MTTDFDPENIRHPEELALLQTILDGRLRQRFRQTGAGVAN